MWEDELNVDELEYGRELADVLSLNWFLTSHRGTPPGEAVKELKPALAALDSVAAAASLESGRRVEVTLSTGVFELGRG